MIRAIVVDDMEIARFQIGKVCKILGFDEVVFAQNGEEAWTLLQGPEQVDAVISDYNMPGLTGEQLLEKVKASPRFNDLPFIFVTSETEKPQIVRLMGLGIAGYITKPFSVESLERDLRRILEPHVIQIKS